MSEIKLTKNQARILDYLQNNDCITVKECFDLLGSTELRKIISDLRKKGLPITTTMVKGTNRYGEATHYNEYRLEA